MVCHSDTGCYPPVTGNIDMLGFAYLALWLHLSPWLDT
jgi:hypothetical protein